MLKPANHRTWLTARRLRAHGILLGVTIWSIYLWVLATPGWRDRNGNLKGTDFLHLYTLGTVAVEHRGGDLYDMNAQATLAARRVPAAAGIRYLPLYPPQVSLFLMPLAHFSYGWALAVWWIFSGLVYGTCCYSGWRMCPQLRGHGWTVALLAAALPAFFHLIAWGQTSAVALAIFTLAFFLLRERREFLAGLTLGCLIFKPQLGLAVAIVFIAVGAWKTVAAALLSAGVQLAAGVLYYGMEPLRAWLRMLSHVQEVLPLFEPRPYQTHCLRTFWAMIVPWHNLSFLLYGISLVLVLAGTIAVWSRPVPLCLRYSALLLATVLVAPHLTVYDLVILVPAMLLVAEWLLTQSLSAENRHIGTLLYLTYVLPLLGPLARWTHVQVSVVAMSALLYLIFRARTAPKETAQTTEDTKVHEGLPC